MPRNCIIKYKSNYTPQGFASIESERQKETEKTYGDFYSLALKLNEGNTDEIQTINWVIAGQEIIVPKETGAREPSVHDEIQWKLIKLGKAAGNDVWVPKSDQGKIYDGFSFKDFVLRRFEPGLDIPKPVENIDCVWRFGFQITSAPYLKLKEAIRFLSYDKVRDLDERFTDTNYGLTTEMVLRAGEVINGYN